MKSISQFLKGITLTLFALGIVFSIKAQTLPVCSGTGSGLIYFASHDSIFVMNPTNPTAFSYTGITLPLGTPSASALAVSSNLNGGSPSPTYYTTFLIGATRYVHYWNGTTWVNTGAALNSDNIAGGGGYLFSYDPSSGLVFRYNGVGAAVFLVNAGNAPTGPKDIAADCAGNFYIINSTDTAAALPKTVGTANTLTGDTTYPTAFANKGNAALGTIGTATTFTGDTEDPSAFGNISSSYRLQLFYTAADLTAAGVSAGYITSIGFNLASLGSSATNANFAVKMALFPSSFTGATTFQPMSTATTVFGPSTYTHTSSGQQTISFTTPFYWDGVSTLAVDFTYDGASSSSNANTYYTSNASTIGKVVYDLSKTSTIGNASSKRPNTTFGFNRAGSYRMQLYYTAADLTAVGISGGNITSIAFNTTSLGGSASNNNFTVKLASLPASVSGAGTFQPIAGISTTVFGPSTYTHTSSGLQTINFTTPYFWDGVSTLVVDITYNVSGLLNNANTYFTTTAVSGSVVYDTSATSTTGISTSQRPNTTFGYTAFPKLKKYSSAGSLLNTYTFSGRFAGGGGGLAVNGNNVYYDGIDSKLYSGVIAGAAVNFTASSSLPFTVYTPTDFGSCGSAGFNGNIGATDTVKSCNGANNVALTATGPGPYNWTVLSGPATITGSGSTVTVSSPATSVIIHNDANCAGNNLLVDTTVVFIANGTIDAGPDRTIFSCGQAVTDSIRAKISNATPGISYAFNWINLPVNPPVIIGGNTDTQVIFQISKSTCFALDVSTISGCHFRDTACVKVVDSTPKADFQYVYHYGCTQDTVCFFNTSRGGIDSFAWNFRDSVGNNGDYYYTDAVSPCHIFHGQGFYPVVLLAKNRYCQDTINKLINVSHPLLPDFNIDDSTACSNHLFAFTDKSVLPCSNPLWVRLNPCVKYKYDFGDGTSSTLANPTHMYRGSGTYKVTLTLVDQYLFCTATKTHTIVVDSLPFARIISADTAICQGQAVHLKADYLSVGNTGITYDLGDGTVFQNSNEVTYGFPTPGTYNVTLTAHYRYCPDFVYTYPFIVRPFPGINLGPDTVLCPNGAPVVLSDRVNLGNTTARYLWSTGETTPAIAARNDGTYWARVNIGGCAATDSIMVRKDCYVDIPNSFTPNGDGTNDYFLPRQLMSRSVSSFKMTIYNRWGQQVFQTETIDGRGWDGKFNGQDQVQGVYVYQIDVAFDNAVKEHYTGNLTLLR